MVKDRRGHNTMVDTTTFVATTERNREMEATVIAGGDRTAHQPGPWGEVRLHRALSISVVAVGPSRMDLETAALSPLQPPSNGQDWKQVPSSGTSASIFPTHSTDNTYDVYHGQLELPQTESAKQPVSFTTVLVSIVEGRIIGSADWELPRFPPD